MFLTRCFLVGTTRHSVAGGGEFASLEWLDCRHSRMLGWEGEDRLRCLSSRAIQLFTTLIADGLGPQGSQ
jgi:hypothetical protein